MTPIELEVLLSCSTPFIRMGIPSDELAIASLVEQGLIVLCNETTSTYMTSAKGDAHIRQMCSLALPVPVWGDTDGNIIKTT